MIAIWHANIVVLIKEVLTGREKCNTSLLGKEPLLNFVLIKQVVKYVQVYNKFLKFIIYAKIYPKFYFYTRMYFYKCYFFNKYSNIKDRDYDK